MDYAQGAEGRHERQNSDVQITDDLHLVALTDDEYEPVMLFIFWYLDRRMTR